MSKRAAAGEAGTAARAAGPGRTRLLGQRMSLSPSFSGASGVPHAGQCGRHHERALGAVAQVDDRPDDLGDDVAGLAQHHRVADQHALALDLVRRCAGWPCSTVEPATTTGSMTPNGVTRPVRPTLTWMSSSLVLTSSGGYLKAIAQRGAREVEPSRRCTRDLVDLDHDAVDLVLDVVPVLAVVVDVAPAPRSRSSTTSKRSEIGSPHAAQRGVGLALALGVEALARADAVHEHAQRPGRGDPRVLLPQRAGGGVARVGERRLARLDQAAR